MKDRTSEFLTTVQSISSRQNDIPIQCIYVIIQVLTKVSRPTRSEFTKAASEISQALTTSSQKLEKLARLARNKSLFDDTPQEINALIFVIKQDISKINRQITTLAEYSKPNAQQQRNKQAEEHARNVVVGLQGTLASCSKTFQGVLEVRTKTMKEQETRRDAYSYAPQIAQGSQSSALYDPPSHKQEKQPLLQNTTSPQNTFRNRMQDQDTVIQIQDSDSGFGFSQQQQSMPSLDSALLATRSTAIDTIEQTIAELGQIYQHFAVLLSQQRESVMRIDESMGMVEQDVEGAHGELLRYYQGMSGNRMLMVKAFGAVLIFFLIYSVFFS